MNLYAVLFDVIVVLILLLITLSAYRKGFLHSVILLAGYVASVIAAALLSGPAAGFIYERFLEPSLLEKTQELLDSVPGLDQAEILIHELTELLPDVIVNPVLAAYGGEAGLAGLLENGAVLSGQAVSEHVVGPIVISMLQALLCLLIFFICVIIIKMIARSVQGVGRVPVLGPVNSALGAFLGVLQAIVAVYLLALAVSVIISLTADQLEWLNTGIVNATILFRRFYEYRLFA